MIKPISDDPSWEALRQQTVERIEQEDMAWMRAEIVRLRAALKDIGQYTGDPAIRRVVVTALEQSDVVQFHDNRILPAEPHGVRIAAADHEQREPENKP